MKSLADQYTEKFEEKIKEADRLSSEVSTLYHLANNLLGKDRFSQKIKKLEADDLIHSEKIEDRILALHHVVFNAEKIQRKPEYEDLPSTLASIEGQITEQLARRVVEHRIEKEMMKKVEEKQDQYLEEIKIQILKKKTSSENPYTLKKYVALEKLEEKTLSKSAMELFRPQKFEEIVGQEKAIKSLITKIASPYPQHIIIYGPPGVGKTTVARLALEYSKTLEHSIFDQDAKFVEVDGTTLRWDPREITNPLLGSVHDPIYQGSKRDLAEGGIPEPKLGLVTDAHGGILFIDEIGELDDFLQNKLLKVLEDKRVSFDSAYYDPDNPATPLYVKKLFDEGAPADFVLIGATTRQPHEINSALRSRCVEVFFDPLFSQDIEDIVSGAAHRIGVALDGEVPEIISQYTNEGRKAINILSDSYGIALYEGPKDDGVKISKANVYQAIQMSRLVPLTRKKASNIPEVGKVFGLGVRGFLGSVIELESIAFKSYEKGRGNIRFNDTAGTMAKDSIFNAASVVRKITGEVLSDYDIHVNAIGGGNIDGPSAGVAIVTAMISAIQNKSLRQDVAITGEISIQGKLKPVGGINEKIYGAKQAGMKAVIIPTDNRVDVHGEFKDIEIIPLETIEEVLDIMVGK